MLLNVKVENHIEKNTGNTGEGENILRVIIAVGCYKQTNKYNIARISHTLFGAADEEAAIRRRVQRGCMSFDGSNDCAFWCYSSLFIPQPFYYLARDY